MNVIELTRRLIEIPSPSGREQVAGDFAADWLGNEGFEITRQEIEPGRFNIFAAAGHPVDVVLCTHLDTVPNPAESAEDADFLYGRGSCDAKGPMAAMMIAGKTLRKAGFLRFGILLVAGEETDSLGARTAGKHPAGSRAVVIGEPTQNKMALGHKGFLFLRLETKGRAAHSAFPHLGQSAINELLDVLKDIRAIDWPADPVLGISTLNIGRIEGGAADNVIAPEARATVAIRCSVPARIIRNLIVQAVAGRANIEIHETDPVRFSQKPGYGTTVLPFGSDAPYLESFGERYMLGPGDPQDAHTDREKINKRALEDAVDLYARLVRELADDLSPKAAGR